MDKLELLKEWLQGLHDGFNSGDSEDVSSHDIIIVETKLEIINMVLEKIEILKK